MVAKLEEREQWNLMGISLSEVLFPQFPTNFPSYTAHQVSPALRVNLLEYLHSAQCNIPISKPPQKSSRSPKLHSEELKLCITKGYLPKQS